MNPIMAYEQLWMLVSCLNGPSLHIRDIHPNRSTSLRTLLVLRRKKHQLLSFSPESNNSEPAGWKVISKHQSDRCSAHPPNTHFKQIISLHIAEFEIWIMEIILKDIDIFIVFCGLLYNEHVEEEFKVLVMIVTCMIIMK